MALCTALQASALCKMQRPRHNTQRPLSSDLCLTQPHNMHVFLPINTFVAAAMKGGGVLRRKKQTENQMEGNRGEDVYVKKRKSEKITKQRRKLKNYYRQSRNLREVCFKGHAKITSSLSATSSLYPSRFAVHLSLSTRGTDVSLSPPAAINADHQASPQPHQKLPLHRRPKPRSQERLAAAAAGAATLSRHFPTPIPATTVHR